MEARRLEHQAQDMWRKSTRLELKAKRVASLARQARTHAEGVAKARAQAAEQRRRRRADQQAAAAAQAQAQAAAKQCAGRPRRRPTGRPGRGRSRAMNLLSSSDGFVTPSAGLAAGSAPASYALGDVVEGRYRNKGEWFRGRISKVHPPPSRFRAAKFDVAYDHGDAETSVPAERLRHLPQAGGAGGPAKTTTKASAREIAEAEAMVERKRLAEQAAAEEVRRKGQEEAAAVAAATKAGAARAVVEKARLDAEQAAVEEEKGRIGPHAPRTLALTRMRAHSRTHTHTPHTHAPGVSQCGSQVRQRTLVACRSWNSVGKARRRSPRRSGSRRRKRRCRKRGRSRRAASSECCGWHPQSRLVMDISQWTDAK